MPIRDTMKMMLMIIMTTTMLCWQNYNSWQFLTPHSGVDCPWLPLVPHSRMDCPWLPLAPHSRMDCPWPLTLEWTALGYPWSLTLEWTVLGYPWPLTLEWTALGYPWSLTLDWTVLGYPWPLTLPLDLRLVPRDHTDTLYSGYFLSCSDCLWVDVLIRGFTKFLHEWMIVWLTNSLKD